MITIATDGSCYPNPGPGGWAWVDEHGAYASGAFAHGTNNVGELTAILEALRSHDDEDVEIQYDSEYAVKSVTIWGPSWRQRGIMSEKKNHEIIGEVMDVVAMRDMRGQITVWTKVKGHTGHQLNEAADLLAGRMTKLKANHQEHGHLDLDTLDVSPHH